MFDFTFYSWANASRAWAKRQGHRSEVLVLRTHNDMNAPLHKVQNSVVRVTIVGLVSDGSDSLYINRENTGPYLDNSDFR